jgi:hypothetical protein
MTCDLLFSWDPPSWFAQPHPRPSAIFRNKCDSSRFNCGADFISGSFAAA